MPNNIHSVFTQIKTTFLYYQCFRFLFKQTNAKSYTRQLRHTIGLCTFGDGSTFALTNTSHNDNGI